MSVHYWDGYYHELLAELLNMKVSKNERTGEEIRALPCLSITLLPTGVIPVLSTRAMFPKTAAIELAWQLMGTQDATWINERCPIWKKFTDKKGNIETAYGYRWESHFGVDQINEIITKLTEDPSSRQCYVTTFDPMDMVFPKPNIPCPVGFTVNIMEFEGKQELHMSVNMRSSDVVAGLPYDVMTYALLQSALANQLNVDAGCLQFTLAHAHMYEKHASIAKTMIENYNDRQAENWEERFYFPHPAFTIDDIKERPERYVQEIDDLAGPARHGYKPKPEIFQ